MRRLAARQPAARPRRAAAPVELVPRRAQRNPRRIIYMSDEGHVWLSAASWWRALKALARGHWDGRTTRSPTDHHVQLSTMWRVGDSVTRPDPGGFWHLRLAAAVGLTPVRLRLILRDLPPRAARWADAVSGFADGRYERAMARFPEPTGIFNMGGTSQLERRFHAKHARWTDRATRRAVRRAILDWAFTESARASFADRNLEWACARYPHALDSCDIIHAYRIRRGLHPIGPGESYPWESPRSAWHMAHLALFGRHDGDVSRASRLMLCRPAEELRLAAAYLRWEHKHGQVRLVAKKLAARFEHAALHTRSAAPVSPRVRERLRVPE